MVLQSTDAAKIALAGCGFGSPCMHFEPQRFGDVSFSDSFEKKCSNAVAPAYNRGYAL